MTMILNSPSLERIIKNKQIKHKLQKKYSFKMLYLYRFSEVHRILLNKLIHLINYKKLVLIDITAYRSGFPIKEYTYKG